MRLAFCHQARPIPSAQVQPKCVFICFRPMVSSRGLGDHPKESLGSRYLSMREKVLPARNSNSNQPHPHPSLSVVIIVLQNIQNSFNRFTPEYYPTCFPFTMASMVSSVNSAWARQCRLLCACCSSHCLRTIALI